MVHNQRMGFFEPKKMRILSRFTPEEFLDHLKARTKTDLSLLDRLSLKDHAGSFVGRVDLNGFEIHRDVAKSRIGQGARYTGVVSPSKQGCTIEIETQMQEYLRGGAQVGVVLGIGVAALIVFGLVSTIIQQPEQFLPYGPQTFVAWVALFLTAAFLAAIGLAIAAVPAASYLKEEKAGIRELKKIATPTFFENIRRIIGIRPRAMD